MNRDRRSCSGCTACCEGWLFGQAYNEGFWPGRKCFYLGCSGCTIYKDRPEDPCKTYRCEWLNDPINIPEWLKPNISKVILTKRTIENIEYIDVEETGEKLDSSVLSWLFFKYTDGTFPNICYRIDGGRHFFGSQEYIDLMQGKT